MKLSDLTESQAKAVLDKVETALASKFTKSRVVAELANEGLCSPSSSGTENTLLRVARDFNYLTPLFSKLMGADSTVKATPQAQAPAAPSAPAPSAAAPLAGLPPVPQTQTSSSGPAPRLERRLVNPPTAFSMGGVNLRAIEILELTNGTAKAHLRDGSIINGCSLTESTLQRSCTVIELGG